MVGSGTKRSDGREPAVSITSGFDGGACPTGGVPPFSPQVTAGTLEQQRGLLQPVRPPHHPQRRRTGDHRVLLPAAPGLVANLTGVPFCSEADIALAAGRPARRRKPNPACPAASQIGYTEVGAGVGDGPRIRPGKIYMAGPFEGAPFSIVAITSAKVGPFDLGTVVVHLPLQHQPGDRGR